MHSLQRRRVGIEQTPEPAETAEQVAAQLDGREACGAPAQQHRQQLGVRQAAGTGLSQALPGRSPAGQSLMDAPIGPVSRTRLGRPRGESLQLGHKAPRSGGLWAKLYALTVGAGPLWPRHRNCACCSGVTGGIAAYKSPDIVRRLLAAGAEVRVVMTPSAARLVSPTVFQAVSGEPVRKRPVG